MQGVTIDGDHLQLLVCEVQDGAAGGLVDAAVLHADQTVLNDVDDADAVGAAQSVQLLDDLGSLHLLAVDADGCACLEVDGDVGGGVGCCVGGDAHLQEAGLIQIGLVGGILQVQTLVAQVPQVLVLGVGSLTGELQGDVVGLCVVDLLVTGLDIPLTPGGDDLHVGSETLDGQLETDLVIALAGGAVADGVCALSQCDLGQLLADDGTGESGAQQVGLVLCVHLQGGDDDLFDHLIHQISDDQLGSAGGQGLFFQAIQLVSLTDVAGHGDDFGIAIIFLQPGNDDGSIQTAGIGKNNFLNRLFIHKFVLQVNNIHVL